MRIELSEEDMTILCLSLGIALGASSDMRALFKRIIKLTNKINKDNPNWIPYEEE